MDKDDWPVVTCPVCHGVGKVGRLRRKTCPHCNGKGSWRAEFWVKPGVGWVTITFNSWSPEPRSERDSAPKEPSTRYLEAAIRSIEAARDSIQSAWTYAPDEEATQELRELLDEAHRELGSVANRLRRLLEVRR